MKGLNIEDLLKAGTDLSYIFEPIDPEKQGSKTVWGIQIVESGAMPPGTGMLVPSAREIVRLMVEEHLTTEEIAGRYACLIHL